MLNKLLISHGKLVSAGFVVICVLQCFAFTESGSPFYNQSFGWSFNFIIVFILLGVYLRFGDITSVNGVAIWFTICFFTNWLLELYHSYGSMTLFSSLYPIVLSSFVLLKNEIKERAFCYFRIMFVIMSFCGIIAYFLYIFDLYPPLSFENMYDGTRHQYANYGLAYLFVPTMGLTRLCGLFNEPGYFGTIGALVLIADKCRVNKCNIIIFFSCILSFSVAFFVLIFFFIFLQSFFKKNYSIIFFILIFGYIIYIVLSSLLDSDYLEMFIDRFMIEDGKLAGDLRISDNLDLFWTEICNDTEKSLFGLGKLLPPTGSSSYKILVIKHGIIGVFLIFAPFLFAAFSLCKKNTNAIILCTAFIISIYQRPQIFTLVYFLVLIGGIIHLKKINIKNNR